jgi:CheY-like chemotaxis protein
VTSDGGRRPKLSERSRLLAGLQAKFLPRMIEAARECLDRCAEGLARGDGRVVAAALHVVAGEASALGLEELAAAASAAEQRALAWQGDPAGRPACAEALEELRAVASRLEGRAVAGEGLASGGAGARVLVVDDSALSAEAICDALDDAGLLAELALDLPAALKAITEFQPAVVLTDVQMPGLDPRAVCQALRQAAAPAAPRVVLMSGASQDELAAALAHTGADAGVSKHDGTSAIVRAVRAVLP